MGGVTGAGTSVTRDRVYSTIEVIMHRNATRLCAVCLRPLPRPPGHVAEDSVRTRETSASLRERAMELVRYSRALRQRAPRARPEGLLMR